MSDLGDVLELMHTCSQRWTSLRMEGVEWRKLKAFDRAWEHHVEELRKTQSVRTVSSVRFERIDGREAPEETSERWRVWMAKPDKRRAQFQVGDELVTAVFSGDWWWSWSPSRGFITNGGAPTHSHGFGPGEGLIDPQRLIASLDVRVDARTTFLGRSAFVVTAVPRVDDRGVFDRVLHMVGTGADEYRLVIDGQVGVLLRTEARYQGDAFRVVEAGTVGVDESLADRVFDPEPLRTGIIDPY